MKLRKFPIFELGFSAPSAVCGYEPNGSLYEKTAQLYDGPHGHTYYEFLYLVDGRATYGADDGELNLVANDVVLTVPGESHDRRDLFNGQEYWLIGFGADLFDGACTDVLRRLETIASRDRACTLSSAQRPVWHQRLAQLDGELAHPKAGSLPVVRAIITLCCVDLLRLVRRDAGSSSREALIAETVAYIERHYREGIGLREVSAALGNSASYLTSFFRERMGVTVQDWIIERRIRAARQMLAETRQSIGSIAEKLGYDSPQYFTRQFTQRSGTAPSIWRRGQQEGSLSATRVHHHRRPVAQTYTWQKMAEAKGDVMTGQSYTRADYRSKGYLRG